MCRNRRSLTVGARRAAYSIGVWRVDRTAEREDDVDDDVRADDLRAPEQVTSPQQLSLGDPRLTAGNAAEPVWDAWREQLSGVGGTSPLIHFSDHPRARIELSTTHPGGLAQFITGKTTLLSSLIRDEVAFRAARIAAGFVEEKGTELATVRGIDAVELGIGMVDWRHADVDHRGPVLLRPLAIRRHGRDFEVRLLGQPVLNPALADALRDQFGIVLDAEAFVALAQQDGSFTPNPVIDRLRGLTAHLPHFSVHPRLVVSTFAEVASSMVEDTRDLSHPVLDALAGNPSAKWQVEQSYRPVEQTPSDERSPETDTLLLDADDEQENVIAQITAGNSIVVKTLPGTGGTQTIVNALGGLVAANKRVLVVSPRRATLRGIASRFVEVQLPGVAVTPATLRRDLIRAIGRNEKSTKPNLREVDDALVRLRKVLLDYRGALGRVDPAFGVSVLDCLVELSRLSLLPVPPATTARLSRSSVEAMVDGRARVAETMVSAANLGEFKYGPDDSPWYGARFASSAAAHKAHQTAQGLHATELPTLLQRANDLIGSTHMRPFTTIGELGVYLRLLTEIRDTLDRFLPVVFDRSVSELVAATAPRGEGAPMSATNRRRLKKLAREYVRPGVHVSDLHEALTRVQQQRVLWQRYVAAGVAPEIPTGIADVQVLYSNVAEDLARLDEPLGNTSRERQLANLPIDQLVADIGELAAESDVLHNLQERTELMTTLRDLQLEPLITDLANRHVPESQVPAELELAWWQSCLEMLLEGDRALLGANTDMLDRVEADFRLVDDAHAAGVSQGLAWQLAENWKVGLVDWPDEAAQLKAQLRQPAITSRLLQDSAPHLSRAIAPVWLASPYEVPQIADTMPFDTVILVDAGAVTIAETVGAIRRAKQTVVFGDPVTQTPSPFRIAVDPDHRALRVDEQTLDSLHADSALAKLSTLLPTLSLTRSYRAGGEDLAELVNRRFYGGRIESLPWAGSFLGHGSIAIDYVAEGKAVPDPESGAVESVDAEVDRVVRLVLDHAKNRPTESLMVITASAKHAVRVEQAVLAAVQGHKDLTEFVIGDRPEPFMVVTLEQSVAQSRDRVVFSIGYGRTPHGRVLRDFGPLGKPGGERLLAVAMTRARRSMIIVTCFQPSDIEAERMGHGTVALAEILAEVRARTSMEYVPDDSDPLLVDLARRLEMRGIPVALGHRGKLGLVAAHGGVCVTIETDASLAKGSLRESLRLRPEVLRRLGWHYVRVHAFQLFSDPDRVATTVAQVLGVDRGATQEIAIPPVPARQ
ncbi:MULTISPECIES: ATP-binding protein [unclassified Curtobacterium]|uniref:ATP-binding protein n=1 Tax=unclassified Curtobacterium TaxID=257496 RepID=UPI000DA9D117|nr:MULTISPECIES: ATP-binding protein [unclassified Curtobacterium]PZE23361.1 AAA family ATPase [Curtobacterium sp. MCBD17_028]PZE74788.1 AAA family ATPase [Curtobacterium sp. MCBD17_019]PZF60382.1 AAA family ATPase [Curtobacterium sp. MCBD17_034]PZM35067.1 AAA family ATPase [Curtobacterium sp. MCBD17_031]WIE54147.1 ATP-binding protein [Curtobacterium sp. MCBD17_003]